MERITKMLVLLNLVRTQPYLIVGLRMGIIQLGRVLEMEPMNMVLGEP